jgi:hypothetical protein
MTKIIMNKIILKTINFCLKQAYDFEKKMKEIDKAMVAVDKEIKKYLK